MKHCACYPYGVLCLLQRKPLHFPLPMYLIKNFYTICHFCVCVWFFWALRGERCLGDIDIRTSHIIADHPHGVQGPVCGKTVNNNGEGERDDADEYCWLCVGGFGVQHRQPYGQYGQYYQHESNPEGSNVKLLLLALVVQNGDEESLCDQTKTHAERHEIKRGVD